MNGYKENMTQEEELDTYYYSEKNMQYIFPEATVAMTAVRDSIANGSYSY